MNELDVLRNVSRTLSLFISQLALNRDEEPKYYDIRFIFNYLDCFCVYIYTCIHTHTLARMCIYICIH